MSILLADIDATCAALGYNGRDDKYYAEPEAIHGLKHLIWVLRRDLDNHEYRRHLGHSKVLQTDLIPMLTDYIDDEEYLDVLIRLLVILTNPTLLLYRDAGIPKDNHGRKIYLELIDILQAYKRGFAVDRVWTSLAKKLNKMLNIDWAIRREEQGLLIERILVLTRNVLQVPANPESECRADNDASLHDQIIWSLNQSGILNSIALILGSADQNQYHLHALEILCLLFREQTAETLANGSGNRSTVEKQRDERELISARAREKKKFMNHPPVGRHSRFGGTYVLQNFKSVSDNDIIYHQCIDRAASINFDREKSKRKRSHRLVGEDSITGRRSAFSIRACLREFCIDLLESVYNNLVREVKRILERNTAATNCDDSYLLWAIRFFMEFNRLTGLELDFVSESLSIQCFHWVLTRAQHNMDMITCDKKHARLWARRLHVTIQAFRELLLSLLSLQKMPDEKPQSLFDMLLNNICYVLEYRETVLHLLMNYNEVHSTKAYLRDVVETANIFIKIMEKFCQGPVVVQDRKRKNIKRKKNAKTKNNNKNNPEMNREDLENKWSVCSLDIINFLQPGNITLPEEDHPIPFDAASDKNIEDQKEDCMMKIYSFLHEENYEQAILLLRAGREVWLENDCFGSITAAPEDELLILREIYLSDLGSVQKTNANQSDEEPVVDDEEYDDDEENDEPRIVEKNFRFEDLTKRLANPTIIRACTILLSDWDKIEAKSLKSTVTILHRIAVGCNCPAMLFQATLFRIFQQVFDAPRDPHQEELRRLGIYVIRKFTEIAVKNPKIYAELLFFKNIRQANELEFGYSELHDVKSKNGWSEEEENELRMLFEENQRNPESDQDVIDWILDNLIEKNRSRRGLMKKMKEMGLIFKAPTKKSSYAAANKNLWKHDEDEQLKILYENHRLDSDCLKTLVAAFREKRSKMAIVKRMVQLHLIADESEILPPKKSRKSKKQSSESESTSVGRNQIKKKVKKGSKSKKLKKRKNIININFIKDLLSSIDDKFKLALDWFKESLEEAIEDLEDVEKEEDDGIPLVPILENQQEAVDDPEFNKILMEFGIQPPLQEVGVYWRIPFDFTTDDLKLRVRILNNDEFEEHEINNIADDDNNDVKDNEESENDSDESVDSDDDDNESEASDNDSDASVDYLENLVNKRKQNFDNVVFNKSDIEDEVRDPIGQKSTSDTLFDEMNQNENSLKENSSSTKTKKKLNIDDMLKDNTENDIDLNINSESLRLRLAELSDSENNDSDVDSNKIKSSIPKKKFKRSRIASISESDCSDNDEPSTSIHASNGENLMNANNLDLPNFEDNLENSVVDNVNDDSDDDDIIIKKRKVKENNDGSANYKRRRLVIEDDDEDT